jgi:hypothetical protein
MVRSYMYIIYRSICQMSTVASIKALNLAKKPNQIKHTIQTLREGNPSVVP